MRAFATTCANMRRSAPIAAVPSARSRHGTGAGGGGGGEYLALPLLLLGGVLLSDAQLVLELCSPRMLRAAPA
jgi:hypothetical protein